MVRRMNREDCVLFSGAATGAEETFGECAERYGIQEVNFTFEGHTDARTRGLRVLTADELRHGDVSLGYVSQLMDRRFHDTNLFKKVLQSVWHQINAGREVFVVGRILPNNTIKGGTGWGAEFAKLCNKPLYVFDQDADAWSHWNSGSWQKVESPRITEPLFVGTGTRFLSEAGRRGIEGLFERSF
ncbi:MAG: hypothetical protein ACI8TX_003153 [Hyphomicrobiaceae bacterium]|jgi:hypothetical protein